MNTENKLIENRVIRFLCWVVFFVFLAGGIGMVMELLWTFVPFLKNWSGLCYILVVLLLMGCVYCIFRADYLKHQEMERQLTLYRWEAERLKDAAGDAIRTETTSPLIGALRTIQAKEAELEQPKT